MYLWYNVAMTAMTNHRRRILQLALAAGSAALAEPEGFFGRR